MNKVGKQLVEKATTMHEHGWGASYAEFDKEKFLELIAQECITVCREAWYVANNQPVPEVDYSPRDVAFNAGLKAGLVKAQALIRKHFEMAE